MLALQTVGIGSLIGIILSYMIYAEGEKKLGIDMFRAIIGADVCYIFLVLLIGLAPMN